MGGNKYKQTLADFVYEEPLFIRLQFSSQFGMFHLLGFIKPMQHFSLYVFLYTPFKMLC